MAEHTGSSSLFAIFILSLYSLILIPYTLSYACGGSDDAAVQPWSEKTGKGKKKSKVSTVLKRVFTRGNLVVIALWVVWGLLLWYAQVSTKESKPFDPFEILGVDRSSTDKEVKKAYRQLSLKFHPDKNPDPKAHTYFAEHITKAYQALTDDVSRANYEKYGHPDGPQAMDVGIALPEWIFPKDKKVAPLLLLALVGIGILLPLVVVSWHMLSSNKFTGPNGIMQETLAFYMHSKYNVKESQSLVRIPETLVCAMEFITMPTPSEQTQSLDDLRKMVLRYHPDLKEKTAFWKRKASVLKAHMLLLAHLQRDDDNIPANLQADLRFVLQKSPILLEEMVKIALLPRPPFGYGWLTPTLAIMEMMQCMTQGLALEDRKTQGGKPQANDAAQLLQLPHFDADVLKKLKRRKANNIKELMDLPDGERLESLLSSGLSDAQAEEVDTFLMTLPSVAVASVVCEMQGEVEIIEQDIAKCKVRLILTRPSHNTESFQLAGKGKSVRAFAPHSPLPKDESWYIFLCDPNNNSVLGWSKANLLEAETVGFDRPELVEQLPVAVGGGGGAAAAVAAAGGEVGKADSKKALATANKFISRFKGQQKRSEAAAANEGDASDAGQLIEMTFMAPAKAGKYELQLSIISDSYVGCDRTMPVRLKVMPLTRAISEGRDAKSLAAVQKWESDDDKSEGEKEQEAGSDGEQEEADDDGDDYDSDETGELETGDGESDVDGEKDGGDDEDDEDEPKNKNK